MQHLFQFRSKLISQSKVVHTLFKKESLQRHSNLDHKSSVIKFGYLIWITIKLLQLT